MQKSMVVKETYFGLNGVESIQKLLETVIFVTNLKTVIYMMSKLKYMFNISIHCGK